MFLNALNRIKQCMSFFASCKRSYEQRAWAQWFQLDMQAHAYVNTFSTLDARVNPCLPGEKRLFFCCQIFLCFDFQLNFYDIKKKKRTEPRTFVCSANAQSTGKLQSWEAGHQCSRSGFLPSPGTANSTELWELLKADCSRRTSPFHTS